MPIEMKEMKKFSSFTVKTLEKDALIPFDTQDTRLVFEAVVITNQGYPGKITRVGKHSKQENGRYEFPVEITYLEGLKKGEKRKATVRNYDPAGRYGELFR